jgi:hypothetical protein
MSIITSYPDFSINIPTDVYTELNRASREYDACVTDMYYYIMNTNSSTTALFKEMFDDAIKAHFAYSSKKDVISNNYVIPSIREKYNAKDDAMISNYWSVNFDGSNECKITGITIGKDNQEVIYTEDATEEWLDKICTLNAKIQIYNDLISKLITAINSSTSPIIKACYDEIRETRIQLNMEDDKNRKEFLDTVVKQHIADYDPEKCTWNLNPTDKKLVITHTID